MKMRATLATLLLAAVLPASAQWPNKPIKLVVGFAPAGAADTVARAIADQLGKVLGQPITVENRPGAGSSIAADIVAKSAPDGYTMLIGSPSNISVNPALNPKLTYKTSDLLPVTQVSSSPLVVVVPVASPIQSLRQLADEAKKNPGRLNYGTSGVGSAPHFGAAYFSQVAGVEMTHVPYKGGGPSILGLLQGDTQVSFATPPSALPQVKGGKLRALAVTSRERSALMPDIPGTGEAGMPSYAISFWYGFFLPAGTPPDIVKKLFEATITAANRPEVKAILAREGTEVQLSKSPQDFAAYVAEDAKFWIKLAKESGATVD
jgi:tripartite-type tricarboxylate transporter receptor subunit TctC